MVLNPAIPSNPVKPANPANPSIKPNGTLKQTATGINNTSSVEILPQTGSFVGNKMLRILGVGILGLGAFLFKKKKII